LIMNLQYDSFYQPISSLTLLSYKVYRGNAYNFQLWLGFHSAFSSTWLTIRSSLPQEAFLAVARSLLTPMSQQAELLHSRKVSRSSIVGVFTISVGKEGAERGEVKGKCGVD
jgi:hypothetical protein